MAQHLDNLFRTCHTFPAIDNHAHPILSASYRNSAKFPFKGVVSEAPSSALEDSQSSLACYRATPQLASLLNIPPDATWSQIEIARDAMEWWDLCRTCFERSHIQCLLLDDGLSGVREYAYEYGWHDKLTTSPTKRIVRVEAIAEARISLQSFFYSDLENRGRAAYPFRALPAIR